jgi:adenylate cyclase
LQNPGGGAYAHGSMVAQGAVAPADTAPTRIEPHPLVPRRRLIRATERIGNPLEWTLAAKCLLVGVGILLPTNLWFVGWEYYLSLHPEIAPYIDRPFLAVALPIQLWVFCGGWAGIGLVSLLMRRGRADSHVLKHVTIQFFCVTIPIIDYWLGIGTTEFVGAFELGGAVVGLLLFDKRSVLFGIITFQVVFISLLLAEMLRLMPHAPLLAQAPFATSMISRSWLFVFCLPTLTYGWVTYFLLYYVFDRWRDRELAVTRTSEQLARAMDVISRYVARQVADQILQGDYETGSTHGRRRLTIFFSDIKDFSDAADNLEPEDLSQVLNEYLAEMVKIGEAHGGTIDKFVGDAIMIFFGAPMATDDMDHAVRAIRMAIDMQERMTVLQEKWRREGFEHPFEIRIGINTGHVSVGNFGAPGRMDYTAIGRQVNIAARLESHCEPGRILISHSTWVMVCDQIDCVPKGELLVKGVHVPVKVYEVAGPRQTASA